jgi:hypothetical protein
VETFLSRLTSHARSTLLAVYFLLLSWLAFLLDPKRRAPSELHGVTAQNIALLVYIRDFKLLRLEVTLADW